MRSVLMALVIILTGCQTGPLVRTFTVTEHLGKEWQRELVAFEFNARVGRLPGPVEVTLQDDAGRAVTAQVIERRWHDDGSLASGKVAWIMDLPASSSRSFTATVVGGAPCKAQESRDTVDMGGWRLMLGQHTFDDVPASDVPGPVAGIRGPDGGWYGGSYIYGDHPVRSVAAELLDAGPLVMRWRGVYRFVDETTLTLTCRSYAGDPQAHWQMAVTPFDRERAVIIASGNGFDEGEAEAARFRPKAGWRLVLGQAEQFVLPILKEASDHRWLLDAAHVDGKRYDIPLADVEPGPLVNLAPWDDWWYTDTKTGWSLQDLSGRPWFGIRRRRPGDWVPPAAPGTWIHHANAYHRLIWAPLMKEASGQLSVDFPLTPGNRHWTAGLPHEHDGRGGVYAHQPRNAVGTFALEVGDRLDAVRKLHLDWEQEDGDPRRDARREERRQRWHENAGKALPPELQSRLPYLAMGSVHQAYRMEAALAIWQFNGSLEVDGKPTYLREHLRRYLDLLGRYDTMRIAGKVAHAFRMVQDEPSFFSEEEWRLRRAQMAYLGYHLNSPATWSMERGYCSGNPNMTTENLVNLADVAVALPGHPLARAWCRPAEAMMAAWLDEMVGPAGEWPEGQSHYGWIPAQSFARLAVDLHRLDWSSELLRHPKLTAYWMFLAKSITPPDPREGGNRKPGYGRKPPSGRGPAANVASVPSWYLDALAEVEPEAAANLRWVSRRAQAKPVDPETRPDWGSEVFPEYGAILRHGFGEEQEWHLDFALVKPRLNGWYTSESGGFPIIFARGVPIIGRLPGGYGNREELYISRVLPARPRGDDDYRTANFEHVGPRNWIAANLLPRLDYLAARFTMEAAKSHTHGPAKNEGLQDLPEWPNPLGEKQLPLEWERRLLLVKGLQATDASYLVLHDTVQGGPSLWQLWTYTQRIVEADQRADSIDLPGHEIAGPFALKGDHFVGIGQFGIDLDLFVDQPTDTPRTTLHNSQSWAVNHLLGYEEQQDLLALQRATDGDYRVIVFPREADVPSPRFSRLDDGKLLCLEGAFGTDYVLLGDKQIMAEVDGLSIKGTAAVVQDRNGELVLSLPAEGEITCGEWGVRSFSPLELRVTGDSAILSLNGHSCELRLPPGWRPVDTRLSEPIDGWRALISSVGSIRFVRR